MLPLRAASPSFYIDTIIKILLFPWRWLNAVRRMWLAGLSINHMCCCLCFIAVYFLTVTVKLTNSRHQAVRKWRRIPLDRVQPCGKQLLLCFFFLPSSSIPPACPSPYLVPPPSLFFSPHLFLQLHGMPLPQGFVLPSCAQHLPALFYSYSVSLELNGDASGTPYGST